jgi:hypothetical protein
LNPAKKSQRIGRIDRLGQKSSKLSIFNFICKDSIEVKIAHGLSLKQDLFKNVLDDAKIDSIDFSNKGMAQFIKELEEMLLEGFDDIVKEELEDSEILDTNANEIIDITSSSDEEANTCGTPSPKYTKEKIKEMESIMIKGMDFLKDFMKMVKGESAPELENLSFQIDEKTGEFSFKGKLG